MDLRVSQVTEQAAGCVAIRRNSILALPFCKPRLRRRIGPRPAHPWFLHATPPRLGRNPRPETLLIGAKLAVEPVGVERLERLRTDGILGGNGLMRRQQPDARARSIRAPAPAWVCRYPLLHVGKQALLESSAAEQRL